MSSIIDKILRTSSNIDKYNILCADTHEAYQTSLAMTNHNFYSINSNMYPEFHIKTWNPRYRPLPENYHIIKTKDFPIDLGFDFVLSQNKCGQYQLLSQIAHRYNLPLISLEHTLPIPGWPQQQYNFYHGCRGDFNIFISEYSMDKWGFNISDKSVRVIHHGIDTNLFRPENKEKDGAILSVVNDWINRDHCCNFRGWQRTVQGLKVRVLGDTKGFSLPAYSTQELIEAYQQCSVFYNTSTVSPVPTALMEAMACGAACVSTATCMIPQVITHGHDGLISNDEKELRGYLELLIEDTNLAKELGANARKTIQEKFNLNLFVNKWNDVFDEAYKTIYKVEK